MCSSVAPSRRTSSSPLSDSPNAQRPARATSARRAGSNITVATIVTAIAICRPAPEAAIPSSAATPMYAPAMAIHSGT